MMLNEITTRAGAHKRRKRVGRGESSGHGKTCGRGNKGCQSRAGGLVRPLTEGGQMPIFRRLPKRGFSNFHFRTEYDVVNLSDLEARFGEGETVSASSLHRLGLVSSEKARVKILGHGTVAKKLAVEAHAFSSKAREAIEKAGGTVKLIDRGCAAEKAKAKRNSVKRMSPKVAKKPAGPVPEAPIG